MEERFALQHSRTQHSRHLKLRSELIAEKDFDQQFKQKVNGSGRKVRKTERGRRLGEESEEFKQMGKLPRSQTATYGQGEVSCVKTQNPQKVDYFTNIRANKNLLAP